MTPWVSRLLLANCLAFIAQYLMPGVTRAFDYVPALVLTRPWTLVTYMFLHGGFTHILFTMLGLWFFGPRLEARLGSRSFATLWFVSGVTGALVSTVLAPYASLIGASAGVFGVMFGYARFWPRDQVLVWGIVPVEIRWLVILSTAFAVFAGFSGMEAGVAHFAHLGGFAGAWGYLAWLARNGSAAKWQATMNAGPRVSQRELSGAVTRINLDGVHELSRSEVNRILDKISAQGMGSLTAQERTFLLNFVPPDDRKRWVQ